MKFEQDLHGSLVSTGMRGKDTGMIILSAFYIIMP